MAKCGGDERERVFDWRSGCAGMAVAEVGEPEGEKVHRPTYNYRVFYSGACATATRPRPESWAALP